MSQLNRKALLGVAIVILVMSVAVYCIHAIQDWLEYDFDFPAQDCLLNTWTIEGTVTDEQNHPIQNARIDLKGHHLACEGAIRFPLGTTGVAGLFQISTQVYSPIIKSWSGPTIEPTVWAQLTKLGGTYEVTISAEGYQPYHRENLTDEEVFGGLNIILKRH
jgi:hypothetical protein